MEYLWKAFDPVVILNSEMAEFDLADVNHNFTDVTYVSGEFWIDEMWKASRHLIVLYWLFESHMRQDFPCLS